MLRRLLLFTLLSSVFAASAQITVEQCVDLARENYPLIQKFDLLRQTIWDGGMSKSRREVEEAMHAERTAALDVQLYAVRERVGGHLQTLRKDPGVARRDIFRSRRFHVRLPRSQRCRQDHGHAHAVRPEPPYIRLRHRGRIRHYAAGGGDKKTYRLHEPDILALQGSDRSRETSILQPFCSVLSCPALE